MNNEIYKQKMFEIVSRYPKKFEGAKYIRKWDEFWEEKNNVVNSTPNLSNVRTALDIGTGVGMLPYLLKEKGISVDATDLNDELTGKLYTECCDLIDLKKFELIIKSNEPMSLKKSYDVIYATRTVFDRQENWNWKFFIDDCFTHCETVHIKTNLKTNNFPDYIQPFLWKFKNQITGIPYGQFLITIEKKNWV